MRPAIGRPSNDPAETDKNRTLSMPGVRSRVCLTSGTRDIQDANAKPFTAKTRRSPLRAARTVCGTVGGFGLLGWCSHD